MYWTGAGDAEPATHAKLSQAKRGFTLRRASLDTDLRLVRQRRPQAGDLVLARVDTIGHHAKLESPEGRRVQLYEGDLILVAYGDRYAPDQFEAVVPEDLGPCQLVASGGVAGMVVSRHPRARGATGISPLGLLQDAAGATVNLSRFGMPRKQIPAMRPRVVAVVGTSMNAGKTTTAASLIQGLTRAGLRVEATKVTGTGSGNDYWSMRDAGASQVLDFTDMGYATTAGLPLHDIERTAVSLIAHCAAAAPDVIVVELADGLLQRETAALISSEAFRGAVDAMLFAAADAMGALSGREWLISKGVKLIGVSGLVTASPLSSREAAAAIGEPLIGLEDLLDPITAPTLVFAQDPQARHIRACA